jgi:hypothetical protein
LPEEPCNSQGRSDAFCTLAKCPMRLLVTTVRARTGYLRRIDSLASAKVWGEDVKGRGARYLPAAAGGEEEADEEVVLRPDVAKCVFEHRILRCESD